MNNLAKKFISYLENTDVPLIYYITSFLAAISIRNFLEIFSDTANVPFRLFPLQNPFFFPSGISIAVSFWHYYIFWITLFLAIAVIFSLVIKETIDKTIRVTLVTGWIIIITPVVDLIFSKGKGINITYIYPFSTNRLFPFPMGLNPGEIITAVVGITLAAIYCRLKTKNIGKTVLGASLVYVVTFLSFFVTLPIIKLAKLLKLELGAINPMLPIRMLTFIALLEIIIIFYLRDRRYLGLIFKKTGYLKLFHPLIIFAAGILLFTTKIERVLLENIGAFLLTMNAIMLLACLTAVFEEKKTAVTLLLAAAMCAAAVNFTTLFFAVLSAGSLSIYYLPPLRLKNIRFLSNTLISFNYLILIILGWLFAGGEILKFPFIFTFYLLFFCLSYVFKFWLRKVI